MGTDDARVTDNKRVSDSQWAAGRTSDMLQVVLDATPLLVSYLDTDLRYAYANRAYAEWFGLAASDVIGADAGAIIGEAALQRVRPYLQRALAGERLGYDIWMPYPTGRRFVHFELVPDRDDATGEICGLVALLRDATAQHVAEQEVRRQAEELSLLYETGRLIGQSLDTHTIYASFQSMVSGHMDTDALIVSEYTLEDNKIRCTFAYIEGEIVDISSFPILDLAASGTGMQSDVIRSGHPLLIADYAQNPERQQTRYFADSSGTITDAPEENHSTQSLLLVPLKLEGRVLGVVQLQSHRRNAYTEDHLRLLEAMTVQVAAASRNAYLYMQLEQAARLQRAFLRDMLASVTDGRLRLCETPAELPAPLTRTFGDPVRLDDTSDMRRLRHRLREAATALHFPDERWQDLESGAGEAAMNAVVHAGHGIGEVRSDEQGEILQIRIEDNGKGISVEDLPMATLQKGFTTAGTFGHGFKMILQTVSRAYLLTGPTGTTVVLEQERTVSAPSWLRDL